MNLFEVLGVCEPQQRFSVNGGVSWPAQIAYPELELFGENFMTYLLFCTDVAPSPGQLPDLSQVVPVKLESMAAAIDAACQRLRSGAVAWRIEGTDGFLMERSDIELECSRRRAGASPLGQTQRR